MSSKKRILFVGEFSGLHTGFSTYYAELLPRLHATGKYEIAEVASYIRRDDPRVDSFVKGRWKVYGTLPTNEQESAEFNKPSSHPADKGQNTNQFGAGIFDVAVADFKPDVVCAIRDNWMDTFIHRSPFREWFKFIWMPTVDSPFQDEKWLDDYFRCESVLAYSDFGVNTLKKEGIGKIKVSSIPARPGVDTDIFYPTDKKSVKEEFGINTDIPIIGSVMRNQSRKMFLDMIDAFAHMKNKYKDKDVQKSVLLLHTSWPDNAHSFNYPRHIYRLNTNKWMQYYSPNIAQSILQTLICRSCGSPSIGFAASLYNKEFDPSMGGIPMNCTSCGKKTATCTNSNSGYTREQLAKIYNMMDIYVQMSIAEGCGMPIQEAKACGVPTLATDHSALSEKVRFPSEYSHITSKKNYTVHHGGIALPVSAYRHEPETGCLRAFTDIEKSAKIMRDILCDKSRRDKLSKEAVLCVAKNYNLDTMSQIWDDAITNVGQHDRSKTWDSPVVVNATKEYVVSNNTTDQEFVNWLYLDVLEYPVVDDKGAAMWLDHLVKGVPRDAILERIVKIKESQSQKSVMRDALRGSFVNENKVVQEWM